MDFMEGMDKPAVVDKATESGDSHDAASGEDFTPDTPSGGGFTPDGSNTGGVHMSW